MDLGSRWFPQKVNISPVLIYIYNRDIVDFFGNMHDPVKSIKSAQYAYIIT
jgi:hypothetical protein